MLEKFCETLHEQSEQSIDDFVDLVEDRESRIAFYLYREKLINYTNMTKQFYRNLLEKYR